MSEAQLQEARAWLADCVWADIEPCDVLALPDDVVERAVERHVDGGAAEFVRLTADLG